MYRTISAIALALVSTLPGIAETDTEPLSKVPKDFQAGLNYAMQFERHYGLVKDPIMQKRLKDIGYKVAAASGQSGIIFVFNVINISDPNALALPGGFIYFTKGIMELDLSDEELAHIVAHECSHVIRRHHARLQTRAGLLSLLQFAAIAGTAIASANNTSPPASTTTLGSDRYGDYHQSTNHVAAAMVASSVGANLLLLSYVRDYELEADRLGRSLATGAGFGPGGSEGMLKKLLSRSYQRPGMGILRTHPYLEDRIHFAHAQAKDMTPSPNPRPPDDYRREVQETLFYWATEFWNVIPGPQAHFLIRNANTALPDGALADDCVVQSLEWEEGLQQRRPYKQRDYGYFVNAYRQFLKDYPNTNLSERVRYRIDHHMKRMDAVYSYHLSKADEESVVPSFGEYFVRNYPKHEKTPEVHIKLAIEYRKGRKYEEAAQAFLDFLERPESVKWKTQVHEEFLLLIPKLEKIVPAFSFYRQVLDKTEKEELATSIRELIQRSKVIEDLGEFSEENPESVFKKELDDKLKELAVEAFRLARAYRGERRFHEAAAEYYKVNRFCPDPEMAELARDELRELQQLRK